MSGQSGLSHLIALWDDKRVWALLDTEDNGLPIWRQARVLCSIPPNRPSGAWQFVLYTKHDDYRYLLKDTPKEISPVTGMKFDNIMLDEDGDVAEHNLKRSTDRDRSIVPSTDGSQGSIPPLVASDMQALRTQATLTQQKNDDLQKALANMQKDFQDQNAQLRFLEEQLQLAESNSPSLNSKEKYAYEKALREERERNAQLLAAAEQHRADYAALQTRLANSNQTHFGNDSVMESEISRLKREINQLQAELNDATSHGNNASTYTTQQMQAKDVEIARLKRETQEMEAHIGEMARLRRSINDLQADLNAALAQDTPEMQAKEAEIARLKKLMSNLQGDLNDAEGRGTDAHEAARLRTLFTETEKELYQLRKIKNDGQLLADYKKTCESLQREVYELRIANNKMLGYKQDAERFGTCQTENAALRRRIAELERLTKDTDVVAMRERLEYYRIQCEKNDAEIARLKALINELQKIINELTIWKDSFKDRENKLIAENIALKNQLDALLYGNEGKKQAAEIERLKMLIVSLQDQNNDEYDHKRRGDFYYLRCQQLEAELKALKEGRMVPITDGHGSTTIFNQYVDMFSFSDGPETAHPAAKAAAAVPPPPPSKGPTPLGVTYLEAVAPTGSNKLICKTPNGTQRGMHCIVGTGSTAELGTISGLGSLFLERGVKYTHQIGELVQVFPLGVCPPGFYVYSYEDRSEMAMLRKRNSELEAELAALKAQMKNNDGSQGSTTRGLDGKDASELERLRLIIQSQQSELLIEKQKCEDFRYQNLRLRMRVASLEDMLDARGIFYERPQDDFIYRDGTKFNVATAKTNVLVNEKNLQEENAHLKKENDSLLARYRMYYQKNEALTIENEELKRKNAQTSGPSATPSSFSVWPFSSSSDTPSSQPTPKPTPVASATLDKPVAAGSSKLDVPAPSGTEKGSVVVIGSGANAEKRTVTGFGSILLDKPLNNTHPAGTQIEVYKPGTEIPGIVDPPAGARNIYPSAVEQVFAAENLALKQEIKQLQTENGNLKRMNNQLKDDLSKSGVPGTEKKVLSLPSTADSEQAEKIAIEYDLKKLRDDNATMKKRMYQLQDDLSKANAGKNSYETQLRMEAMTAEIASNKHRIETLSNENELLKKTSNADGRVVLLTSEVDKLKVDNKNLEESLKRARARVDDPSTPQEARRLADIKANHDADSKALKDTMMIYEDGLNAARRENVALKDAVRTLQAKVAGMPSGGSSGGGVNVTLPAAKVAGGGAGVTPPQPAAGGVDPATIRRLQLQLSSLEIKLFSYEKKAGLRDVPEPRQIDPTMPVEHTIHAMEIKAEAVKMRLEALEDRSSVVLAQTVYEGIVKTRELAAAGGGPNRPPGTSPPTSSSLPPPQPTTATAGKIGVPPPPTVAGLQLQVDHLTSELTKKQIELKSCATSDISACKAVVGTLEDDIIVVLNQNRSMKKQVDAIEAEKKAKAEASSSSWVPSVPSLF